MNHKIFKLLLAISIALLIQIPVLAQSDDFPSDTTTSGQVDVNGSTTGEIETARDIDWFAVDLAADKTYTIDIEGEDTNAGTLRNPILRRIHDADGERLSPAPGKAAAARDATQDSSSLRNRPPHTT